MPRPLRLAAKFAACIAAGAALTVAGAWTCAILHTTSDLTRWRRPTATPLDHARHRALDLGYHGRPVEWHISAQSRIGATHKNFRTAWVPGIPTQPEAFKQLTNDAASRRAIARHEPLLPRTDAHFVEFDTWLFGWPCRALAFEQASTWHRISMSKALIISYFPSGPNDSPFANPNPTPELLRNPHANYANHDPYFTAPTALKPRYDAVLIAQHVLPLRPLLPGFALNTLFYATLLFPLFSAPPAIRRHLRRRRNHCPTCNYNLHNLPTPTCPECGT
jgi:hypothetical protein